MKTGFEIEKEECGCWLKAISKESEINICRVLQMNLNLKVYDIIVTEDK